jgi:hypothetical protein
MSLSLYIYIAVHTHTDTPHAYTYDDLVAMYHQYAKGADEGGKGQRQAPCQ